MTPSMEYRLAGHSGRYLDVAPMISALRFQPSDFEFSHGWLNHVPSRHRFHFGRSGRVTVDALCGCASLSVRPEQADELHTMFKTWRSSYWVPMETNREFASRFRAPNGWVRLFRDIRMAGGASGAKSNRRPSPPRRCRRRRRSRRALASRKPRRPCGAVFARKIAAAPSGVARESCPAASDCLLLKRSLTTNPRPQGAPSP